MTQIEAALPPQCVRTKMTGFVRLGMCEAAMKDMAKKSRSEPPRV